MLNRNPLTEFIKLSAWLPQLHRLQITVERRQPILSSPCARKNTVPPVMILILCLFLTLTVLVPYFRDEMRAYREEDILLELIDSVGAGYETVNVTGWVRVDAATPGAGDPRSLAENTAEWLNLPGRRVERWQNQYAHGLKVEDKTPGGSVFTVLGQTMELQEGIAVSHVMVSAAGVERRQTHYFKQKINEALNKFMGEKHIAVTYSGKMEKELSGAELLVEAENIMTLAGATVKERTVGDNLVSLTGFTPQLTGNMKYGEKRVNLNVALRCNPVERVTYIYAASPVIFTEY